MTMTRNDFRNRILPLKDKVFRLAFRYMKNEDEAKDVVQDVMLKFWESQSTAVAIRNEEAWLITMARNRCLDLLKKAGRKYEQVEERFDLGDRSVAPDRKVENAELVRRIKEAISSLPDQQSEVIRLRDMKGMSYQEIVDETGLDMNVVKVTLHRARRAVRSTIEKAYDYGV
ncbi:MAG: RNA polymerase sigma factor [Flavobacteriales bacterium]|nr:RNA polymerase sigma factor [Flavobacteriales bacterium]